MIASRRITRLTTLWALIIVPTFFLYDCSGDGPKEEVYEGEKLNIGAKIAKEIFSRADNDGNVTSGKYYFSYPMATDNRYTVASVIFGTDAANPQIGEVVTSDGKPFKWDLVGGGTPVFYLDNVSPAANIGSDPMVVEFNSDNKFKAGVYDSIKFTNDLLWGTKSEQSRTTGTIHFDLHHNMSRIRVMVIADNTYGKLDLNGALVQITNVNLNPVSFNRADGSLTLDESDPDNYGPLTLVNDLPDDPEGEVVNWSSDWKNENGFPTFISHSCIVPPQMLAEDETRPRLTIALKNGTTFSGILPHAMEIDPPASSGVTTPYPVTLSFLKEHLITIRTVISETPPSLSFMPVKVVAWVDKGEFDLVAHQAGIYTSLEFFKLMEYYAADNTYQLQRYGPLDESNLWKFNFFSTVVIPIESLYALYGKMKPGNPEPYNYEFNFNGYSVYIRIGSQDLTPVTPQQLHDILAGTNPSPFSL